MLEALVPLQLQVERTHHILARPIRLQVDRQNHILARPFRLQVERVSLKVPALRRTRTGAQFCLQAWVHRGRTRRRDARGAWMHSSTVLWPRYRHSCTIWQGTTKRRWSEPQVAARGQSASGSIVAARRRRTGAGRRSCPGHGPSVPVGFGQRSRPRSTQQGSQPSGAFCSIRST